MINILQIKPKLSKYVKIFNFNDAFCFLNSLSLNKVFVLKDGRLDKANILKLFKKNNLLKDFDSKAKEFASRQRRIFTPSFKQLYLVVAEGCNFKCKYCRQITHGQPSSRIMSRGETKKYIDWFFHLSKNEPRGIVFYGGEPLLNKKVLLDAVAYIRKKEVKLNLGKPIDLTVITNGTNIDKDSARQLKRLQVYIIISIDGRKKEHDKLRVYKNHRGTFNDVLRGYQIYRSAGCRIGISCTIGSHNFNRLGSVFDYFAQELKPVNVGINLPHDDYDNPLNKGMDFKEFCNYVFKIFEKSIKNNLYIEHIMRKLILLFREEIKINDCAACGGRLVILPGGEMGICEGAIGLGDFFFNKVKYVRKMSKAWFLASPLFDKKCHKCLALGLCGGGCPFDGYLLAKKIGHRDERKCYFIKSIVEWGLYSFYVINKPKIRQAKIWAPNTEEEEVFLQKLKARRIKLPLRSSVEYGVIKKQF
jgi:uncharacterized protein